MFPLMALPPGRPAGFPVSLTGGENNIEWQTLPGFKQHKEPERSTELFLELNTTDVPASSITGDFQPLNVCSGCISKGDSEPEYKF